MDEIGGKPRSEARRERVIKPLRTIAPPIFEAIQVMPFPAVPRIHLAWDRRRYSRVAPVPHRLRQLQSERLRRRAARGLHEGVERDGGPAGNPPVWIGAERDHSQSHR